MATNLERFSKDIDDLIRRGDSLEWAMQNDLYPKEFCDAVSGRLKDKQKAKELIEALPNFKDEYETWYSESLALLKQLLPDRVANFVGLYEKPKTRKEVSYGNYVIQDYMQGLTVTRGWEKDVVVAPSAALPQFRQQLAIVKAAKSRFKSSLFEIKQLVQADLFDREIDAARELLKGKYYRAAGAVAGVVLERHLRQVCDDHAIQVSKKHPGIADLNELLKSNSVIDVAQWRHISMLGDIRNMCDHHKGAEPTAEKIIDLIDGTDKVLKTIT